MSQTPDPLPHDPNRAEENPDAPARGSHAPGSPPPGSPPPGSPTAEPGHTSGMAIASLVVSILSLATCVCSIVGVLGIVLGMSARREIRASGGRIEGEGLATAGIILGWIAIGIFVVGVIFNVLFGGLWFMTASRTMNHQQVMPAPNFPQPQPPTFPNSPNPPPPNNP